MDFYCTLLWIFTVPSYGFLLYPLMDFYCTLLWISLQDVKKGSGETLVKRSVNVASLVPVMEKLVNASAMLVRTLY